ncbi:MAG: F0F1 ATP synthase subunit epsilon [Xanthomonadales bacterium]|nr:ATP synthase epsilon chain [Xanthomonadales bacterium]MCC6592933.1 F0F1 ATP synthase subunit epsilon [Xanthomonadales bacterium]MCE7931457.1 F0F1 ATP synthase subunit epsilon [Xanthomonadales bacterium PRO6]
MSTIRVDVVSAEHEVFRGEAKLVVATGEMGELGIAPRHAPLITRLKPGQVRVIQPNDEELFLYVSGGILEVQPTVVTILTDTAVRAADLDEAKVREAKEAAERAIANQMDAKEVAAAQAELAALAAQLQAIDRLRKMGQKH